MRFSSFGMVWMVSGDMAGFSELQSKANPPQSPFCKGGGFLTASFSENEASWFPFSQKRGP
jgi:hypothetical protein